MIARAQSAAEVVKASASAVAAALVGGLSRAVEGAGADAVTARRRLLESADLCYLLQVCLFSAETAALARSIALALLVGEPAAVVASLRGTTGNGYALIAMGDALLEDAKLSEAAAAAACTAVVKADALKVALASVDLSMGAAERAATAGGSAPATSPEDGALACVQTLVRWTQAVQERMRMAVADALAAREKAAEGKARAPAPIAPFVYKRPVEQLGDLLTNEASKEMVLRNLVALSRALPVAEETGARAAGAVGRVRFTPERMVPADAITIEAGGSLARMGSSAANAFVVLNTEIAAGRASWEMKIVDDAKDGECTAFGVVALWPVTDCTYNSNQMYTYRAYNGECYGLGSQKGTNEKFHPGDVVRMDLDLGAGTLGFAVNGAPQSFVFTGVSGPVTPVCFFYGQVKSAALVSFKGAGGQTPTWAPEALAAIVRNTPALASPEDASRLRATLWRTHAHALLRAVSLASPEAAIMMSYIALQCVDREQVVRDLAADRPEALDLALRTVEAIDELDKRTRFCRSPASAPSSESGWSLYRCVTCHGPDGASAGASAGAGTVFDRALCCGDCASIVHAGHDVVYAVKVTEKGVCGEDSARDWSGGDLGAWKTSMCSPDRVVAVMASATNAALGRELQQRALGVFGCFAMWKRCVLDVVLGYDADKLKAGQVCRARARTSRVSEFVVLHRLSKRWHWRHLGTHSYPLTRLMMPLRRPCARSCWALRLP